MPPVTPPSPLISPTASQIGVSTGFTFASEAANAFCMAPFFLPGVLVEDFVGHFPARNDREHARSHEQSIDRRGTLPQNQQLALAELLGRERFLLGLGDFLRGRDVLRLTDVALEKNRDRYPPTVVEGGGDAHALEAVRDCLQRPHGILRDRQHALGEHDVQ